MQRSTWIIIGAVVAGVFLIVIVIAIAIAVILLLGARSEGKSHTLERINSLTSPFFSEPFS